MILQLVSAVVFLGLLYLSVKSLKDPGIALGLTWSVYALEQLLQQGSAFLLSNGSFLNFFVAGIAGVAAFNNIASKKVNVSSFSQTFLLIILLFIYCALSVFWSPDVRGSLAIFRAALPYIGIFVVVAPLCISDTRQLEKCVQVILYFGFIILVGLLFSKTSNRAIVITQIGGSAVKGNPLAISTFAGHVLLAAMFFIYSKRSTSLKLVIYLVIAGVAMVVMARSGSRGQIVGVVIAAFAWLPITAKVAANRSTIIAIFAAAVATLALVYVVSNSDYASRWNRDLVEHNTVGRLAMASSLLEAYGKAGPGVWLFGLGSSSSYAIIGFYPHVVLPEVLGEEGLVGLALFLWIIGGTVYLGFKWIRSSEIDASSRVYLGLMLAFFTFDFILSFKQGSLLGSPQLFSAGAVISWYSISLRKQYGRFRQNQQRMQYAQQLMQQTQQPRQSPY